MYMVVYGTVYDRKRPFTESITVDLGGNHRLIIKNAKYEHAGKYVANVKYKLQTQFMSFNLTITDMLFIC